MIEFKLCQDCVRHFVGSVFLFTTGHGIRLGSLYFVDSVFIFMGKHERIPWEPMLSTFGVAHIGAG